ncbi:MAG: lipoate--protein ligase [Bacteroidales bacterium]|nr:lipoate--protein ligase [Bacteroidales bacterium]
MFCIIDNSTNPYWNLAAEEYLLGREISFFRLWQNEPSIIVGRNQNTAAEINSSFVEEHNIAVVRRLSGGGAVFHDLGNINYSYYCNKTEGGPAETFKLMTVPIIDTLADLGLKAELSGRNDLLVDGKKISGNALYYSHQRMLCHGTILLNASMQNLSASLQSRPEKFFDKAVKSTRSRVANINDFLADTLQPKELIAKIVSHIDFGSYYHYSKEDLAEIDKLAQEKYSSYDWNYGHSPKYSFSRCKKFPSGLIELNMNVENGFIKALYIQGDYFFSKDTSNFCKQLEGCSLDKRKIVEKLNSLPLDDYFYGLSSKELCQLFIT